MLDIPAFAGSKCEKSQIKIKISKKSIDFKAALELTLCPWFDRPIIQENDESRSETAKN